MTDAGDPDGFAPADPTSAGLTTDDPASAVPEIVLASASPSRARVLEGAGVAALRDPAAIDEDAVKDSVRKAGGDAGEVAETLAVLKAHRVSLRHPGAFVIGADQMLQCGGVWFDKPADAAHARAHLTTLRGKTHELISALCVSRDGQCLWQHRATARLTMRDFSDAFLEGYLARIGDKACLSVGAYQIEGPGAQLFSRIEGDYFTILGLPLLPLLDFLRNHGVVEA